MTEKATDFPLFVITPAIVRCLAEKRNTDNKTAMKLLYNSKLYSVLEEKDTGLWHLSPLTLAGMLCEELDTGKVTLPEGQY